MNAFHESHRASVPVRVSDLMIVHCGVCLGFEIHGHTYTQGSEGALETHVNHTFALGPFDTPDDVELMAKELLEQLLSALVGPWSGA
jgi:hypothetical protein